ncbi:hypothetical protein LINGRAHAP2_LOCUS25508 [Linum grandiflorum]
MEERIRGAVQTRPVLGNSAELYGVGGVRSPDHPPEQHFGPHDQRGRHCHSVRVHSALSGLLRQEEARQGCRNRPSGDRLRGAPLRARCGPRAPPDREAIHRCWCRLRAVLPHDLCRSPLCHETGDQDEKRGVHAVHALPSFLRQRRLLDSLRLDPNRLVHHDTKWVRSVAGGGAAGSIRHFLQIYKEADCREESCRERWSIRAQFAAGDVGFG